MSDGRVALATDRLPWLPDEPVRPPAARKRMDGGGILGWAVAALIAVGAGSYWLGTRSVPDETLVPSSSTGRPTATLPLPEATRVVPSDEVQRVTPPEARPVTEPEVRRLSERPSARRTEWRPLPHSVPKEVSDRVARTVVTDEIDHIAGAQGSAPPKRPAPAVAPAVNTQAVKLWPSRYSTGSAGRVVQIGAFGSRFQAKVGWKHMARAYPGVKRLPAVVVEARNSRGRKFYRFQIGTTSQAHSEVLCQRMERIRLSCAVAGLPGQKKAVER